MTRTVKHPAHANRFHKPPALSVMHAFETAVLLMEQAGSTEEDIMKYVHLVHMGWIRNGSFAPEYLELVRQVEQDRREEAATEERLRLLRESAGSNIITQRQG
jgi:hypothetical protein